MPKARAFSGQLDMFAENPPDLFAPTPPPPPPEPMPILDAIQAAQPSQRRQVDVGAALGPITIYGDEDEPVRVTVRGIPIIVAFAHGWQVHAVDGPGSLFVSETGFRSMGYDFRGPAFGRKDIDDICVAIERYIDAPTKNGNGMGGKLVRWWPSLVLQWRQNLAFELRMGREKTWAQWGEKKHVEAWEAHDRRQLADLTRMRMDGIDPDDVGPPIGWKGKWPTFAQGALA